MTQSQGNAEWLYPELTEASKRLLMLLSRPHLTASQRALSRAVAAGVSDWEQLAATAWRKYSLPLVYRHLSAVGGGVVESEILTPMRQLTWRMTAETLRRHAAFDWFQDHCLTPLEVPHLHIKGPALARRYYDGPGLRFFRDVDVLVPRSHRAEVVRHALAQGCSVIVGDEKVDLSSRRALSAYLRLREVPVVTTPQGLRVELQAEVDPHSGLFDTDRLLARGETFCRDGRSLRVLPVSDLFVFISYHHTRHLWSKLNWIADLDALAAAPEFDDGRIRERARELGLGSTVDAVLDLRNLTAKGALDTDFERSRPGVDLLRVCLANLPGEKELESRLRRRQVAGVIGFDWQDVPRSRLGLRLRWLHRQLRPTFEEFRRLPLPRGLHWIYYPMRAWQRLWHLVRKRQGDRQ